MPFCKVFSLVSLETVNGTIALDGTPLSLHGGLFLVQQRRQRIFGVINLSAHLAAFLVDFGALLDIGMNQNCNVFRRGKRPFALTQIHAPIQQHQFW